MKFIIRDRYQYSNFRSCNMICIQFAKDAAEASVGLIHHPHLSSAIIN